MKLLYSILLSFLFYSAYATRFIIGTGSGSVSLTSMTGHNFGDTALIATGVYTTGTFNHLNGIVILPQSGRSYFTNTVQFAGNSYCELGYVSFTGSNNGLDIAAYTGRGGNLTHCYLHNLSFINLKTSCILAHGNWFYVNNDTTKYGVYRSKFDSIYEYQCNELVEGSFGSPHDSTATPDVWDSVEISRFYALNTSANVSSGEPGTEVRGIMFDCNYHDWVRINSPTTDIHGDVGAVYGYGNGNFYNFYCANGPGYAIRIFPTAKVNTPGASVNIWNIGKFNSKEYGLALVQSGGDSVMGIFHSCNTSVYNTTQVNAGDSIGYWCQNVVVGDLDGYRCQIRNNLGVNNTTNGKPNHVIMNQSSDWTTIASDTSNNVYYTSATQATLDSITTAYSNILGNFPTYSPTISSSGINGHGTSNPFSTVDYYGNPYHSAIGYATDATVPVTFTIIPTTDPDLIAYDRGAYLWGTSAWDGTNVPLVPPGNSTPLNSYQRFVWGQIETAQGVYSFTDFDGYVQRAITHKQMFSFGVMGMCSSCSSQPTYGYPTYLHNLMQSETVKDWFYSAGGFWVPNWNSPSYQTRYAALLNALAAHINSTSYNGVPFSSVIYTVEPRGYGDFGEWQTYPWIDQTPAGAVATEASLEAIVNANKTAFPNNQLVIPMGSFDTDPGHSSRLPAQFGYYVLTTSNNYGQIGWRRDNYGDPQYDGWLTNSPGIYNGNSFTPLIMNKYKFAPVDGEPNNTPYSVCCSTGFPCSSGTWSGLYCDIPYEINLFHGSGFGNGNYPLGLGSQIANNINAASKLSGYRLVLDGGSMTTTLISNASFSVTLEWKNVGLAPVYENWNVMFQLRNSGGTTVWSDTSKFNPRLFLPAASDSAVTDVFTIPSLTSGTYSLYMVVTDPRGYKNPLTLAITGRGVDGAYLVRSGINLTTGSLFTVNAGADQLLPFGTTTTTLNGSLGNDTTSGRTYTTTWSKVSGPSGGTITTPSARSTGIAAMVSGTYVFRMSVFDGVSTTVTDDVQVTVAANTPPTAIITGQSSITLPTTTASFSGSSSSDPDGTIASYSWTNVSGPNTPTFTTPTAVSSTVTGLIQGTYVFQLTVTDNLGATGTATATLVVNPVPGTQKNIFTTQTPSGATENDGFGGIELGVKFTSSTSGIVSGIRFYKTTGNNGTHIGELYTLSGTRLAQATFVGESATTGWQTVLFSSPVTISPSTVYVAAYFSPNGTYISTNNGLSSAIANSPLTALADGTSGLNGIYSYSASPTFPTSSYQSSNYWVDVIFTTNIPPTATITGVGTITLPTNSVTLSGTSSSDPDGTISSYAWTRISGPNTPTIGTPAASTSAISGMIAGTYVFQLQVTDNLGSTGTTTKTVVVNPQPNIPPIAVITGSSSINLPTNSVVLDATGSYDPDGTVVSYLWSLQSGPVNINFSSSTDSIITVSALAQQTYVIKLVVTDNAGGTGSTTHTIVVNPPLPPLPNYFKVHKGFKITFK